MKVQDFAIWLVAFAIIIHTIEEGWLPEYQKASSKLQVVKSTRFFIVENAIIFIFVIGLAIVGWRWPILSGILPAIGLTHPFLDHVGLSWKGRKLRPGIWTGLFLMVPFSIWAYSLANTHNLFKLHELVISGAVGLAISIWLYWMVVQEIKGLTQ
ncbi:HXXEE domain-containing protein [Acaryochloris sp. IP29b_bin.148]|uniref:HXXEE domain-containing protein n=1 Tax=Acaryochloris sp. IP29b_bin.148 TaxID=2969218 RepID=UPI00262C3F9C|nr:HXXEE domain-containing protein [Acaryochloris sp. IP29b_bin.148]